MANSNRETIIQVSAAIAKLREQLARIKEELKRHELQLDQLLGGETVFMPEPESGVNKEGDQSLNQRIVALLDSAPHRQFSSDDVSAYLPEANITSIRSGLSRLAEQGRISRPARGRYQGLQGFRSHHEDHEASSSEHTETKVDQGDEAALKAGENPTKTTE